MDTAVQKCVSTWPCSSYCGCDRCYYFLFQNGYTPLIVAARSGNHNVVEVLLSYGPNIDKADYVKMNNWTVFQITMILFVSSGWLYPTNYGCNQWPSSNGSNSGGASRTSQHYYKGILKTTAV